MVQQTPEILKEPEKYLNVEHFIDKRSILLVGYNDIL